MTVWICRACGVEHADTVEPPLSCVICTDERQYVPKTGQAWTTLAELAAEGTRIELEELEPNLFEVTAVPQVAIGQRCYLVRTTSGNLLWDPPGFVDEEGARRILHLGDVVAVVASHPHMYGVQVEWARALGGVPVLVAEPDASWVQRPDAAIATITGDRELIPGLTIRTIGGHFPGSLIAHWADGAEGRGVVLAGDTFFPGPDGKWCTFMRSFPNYLPMSAAVVERVAAAITAVPFDRAYGNLGGVLEEDAAGAVQRSAHRYSEWVRGVHDELT